MNNKTDLDWLARNVHEWPVGATHATKSSLGLVIFGCPVLVSCWFTKQQWLDRRAELQSKPSWKDAPEWATHLVQNVLGLWTFTEFRPEPNDGGGWSMSVKGGLRHCTNLRDGQEGAVLGDWRDTLEHRPEKFHPFTNIEDNQEQDMKQDDGWFERGELPPVGMKCEFVRHDDVDWHESLKTGCHVEILAHYSPCRNGKKVAVFCFDKSVDEDDFRLVEQGIARCFRPTRTEREKAFEEMKQHCPYHGSWNSTYRQFAEALYDAGYRKEFK